MQTPTCAWIVCSLHPSSSDKRVLFPSGTTRSYLKRRHQPMYALRICKELQRVLVPTYDQHTKLASFACLGQDEQVATRHSSRFDMITEG